MSYGNYINEFLVIIDSVDDTINTNSNTPQISSAFQSNTQVLFQWHGLPARENTAKMAVPL